MKLSVRLVYRASRLGVSLYQRLAHSLRYRALADRRKVIWVPLEDIRYVVFDKVWSRWALPPGSIVSSFPDLESFSTFIACDSKLSSIQAHFRDGVPWPETDLFRRDYAARLREGPVRGCGSLEELVEYYARYDALYRAIRDNGLDHTRYGRGIQPLYVHISRRGEFIWTSNCQHRLGICMALGIDPIPCQVRARHRLWQEAREALSADLAAGRTVDARLIAHPDMQDIVAAHRDRLPAGVRPPVRKPSLASTAP